MSIQKLKPLAWAVFIVYLLLLIRFILLKNPQQFLTHLGHPTMENIKHGKDNLILVPFQTTWVCLSGEKGFWVAFENIAGNLLGFAPMGVFLPMLLTSLNTVKRVVITVFTISLCFELAQLFTGVGYCDIDDLIQNTLGGFIGYWLYRKMGLLIKK